MIDPDPLTQVYGKIWDGFESYDRFTDVVKEVNRVRFDEDKEPPLLDSLMPVDVPRVTVLPAGGPFDLFATSNSGSMDKVLSRSPTIFDSP